MAAMTSFPCLAKKAGHHQKKKKKKRMTKMMTKMKYHVTFHAFVILFPFLICPNLFLFASLFSFSCFLSISVCLTALGRCHANVPKKLSPLGGHEKVTHPLSSSARAAAHGSLPQPRPQHQQKKKKQENPPRKHQEHQKHQTEHQQARPRHVDGGGVGVSPLPSPKAGHKQRTQRPP